MRRSRWRFVPAGSHTRRERRTIAVGIVVSAVALFIAFAAMPYARRWSAREEMIEAAADRVHRLQALIANEPRLREQVSRGETGAVSGRLVAGRTRPLAASALQSAIRNYAARSRVSVTRLDLAGTPDSSASPLPSIPASLSAIGDVYGVSEFLSLLQYGAPVVEIRELTLVSNSSLRGGLIQVSVTLNAPAVIE